MFIVKMIFLKVADKLTKYFCKTFRAEYTIASARRMIISSIDLLNAMQKMVNAELISKAVKPTSQTSKPLAII